MQSSLFDRLTAWAELFSSRNDLEFTTPLTIEPVESVSQRYPEDARAFAAKAGAFNLSYRLRDKDHDLAGFLYLSLQAFDDGAYMELDGAVVPEEDMLLVDGDGEGTGQAAWYVLPSGRPAKIVWSVEELVVFDSLTDYLTQGAKRAFSYLPRRWQRGGADALHERSMPRSTPPADLRAALIRRGANPNMAAELMEWLGADVVLLLPRDAG